MNEKNGLQLRVIWEDGFFFYLGCYGSMMGRGGCEGGWAGGLEELMGILVRTMEVRQWRLREVESLKSECWVYYR